MHNLTRHSREARALLMAMSYSPPPQRDISPALSFFCGVVLTAIIFSFFGG